jgi:ABC-type branched-subunit amino acid transport system ATPase component
LLVLLLCGRVVVVEAGEVVADGRGTAITPNLINRR